MYYLILSVRKMSFNMTNKENEALKKESSKSKSKSNYNNSGSVDQALDVLQKLSKFSVRRVFQIKLQSHMLKVQVFHVVSGH